MLNRSLAILQTFQHFKGKMAQLIDPLVQSVGLTPLQAMTLLLLAQGDLTVGALSERTCMGQSNTSTLCKKLERGGFLTRSRNPKDERMVTLSLTEKGRQVLERMDARLARYYQLLDRLPPRVGEEIRRGAQAAQYAMDYLQTHLEGEPTQC